MASEKPNPSKLPVITKGHAQGIRRQYGRDAEVDLLNFIGQVQRGRRLSMIEWVRSQGDLAAQRRRPPSQGVPSGFDIVAIAPVSASGEFSLHLQSFDKRGGPIVTIPIRFLLRITKHATEALFQRLRTQDADIVRTELRQVGDWLIANLAVIGIENQGYLLSPSGVFPVVAGEPFLSDDVDGRYHWVAPTWIADAGLADDTAGKRRIAEAVRRARSQGMQVGVIHPGIGYR